MIFILPRNLDDWAKKFFSSFELKFTFGVKKETHRKAGGENIKLNYI